MSSPLVLYHAGCFDGFAAAWTAKRKMPDAECVPAQYGDSPPDANALLGREVYILDFSFKRAVLTDMAQYCKRLTVLDHHKTAQADLDGLVLPNLTIVFDMAKSGGRLTWEHFFPGEVSPWLIDYTEDRDLWRHALPRSREINAGLRSYPMDFSLWDEMALWDYDRERGWLAGLLGLAGEGAAILRAEQKIVADHVGFAREIEWDGHKVLAVNATVLTSEIAGELAKDRPFGVCWFTRGDGARVYSLRSREGGVDVSEIAKRHGGGGHRQAAGFTVGTK